MKNPQRTPRPTQRDAAPEYTMQVNVEDDALVDPELIRELEASLRRLEAYAAKSKAPATRRAYASDWADFVTWCDRYSRPAMPAAAETIGLYLGSIAEQTSLATLERRLAAISTLHKEAGHDSPASVSKGPLRTIWKGIIRDKTRRQDKAEPLMVEDLRRIIQHLPQDKKTGELTLTSLRDRALLLIGWAGALRRSEIVGLEVADVDFISGEGINLYIRHSKTDQEGIGLIKGIPYGAHPETCPVVALRTWLQAAQITDGPIFRRFFRGQKLAENAITAQYVSIILKKHGGRIGLDIEDFSAHSLRSGFITQAIRIGKSERRVKEHSGHKSWQAFNGYVKQAGTFHQNPGKDIGL
ncbi:MAG TPA: site-specific integrase [Rhodothermales bacterium]|nr:site-specific integrase [Rhodothermales bacterium]